MTLRVAFELLRDAWDEVRTQLAYAIAPWLRPKPERIITGQGGEVVPFTAQFLRSVDGEDARDA